jgi:carboxylate/amino acid/amine transporter
MVCMPYLVIVTLIWSFSFSFIGHYLSHQIDNWFAVFFRILLAFIVFLPFLHKKNMTMKPILLLMGVGTLQLGIMYIFYYQSFLYISIPEILLFTTITPIYVTLFYDLLKKQPLKLTYLLTAVLSVIGTVVIRYNKIESQFIIGFLLIQGANICFALGQVGYKRFMEIYPIPQINAFAWVYAGAAVTAAICYLLFGNVNKLPTTNLQWIVLVWLGIIASGLCYFLWNYGATKVDSGTLAIMNNVVIPLGILVNVIFWKQNVDWLRFISGSAIIILALWVHHRWIVSQDRL